MNADQSAADRIKGLIDASIQKIEELCDDVSPTGSTARGMAMASRTIGVGLEETRVDALVEAWEIVTGETWAEPKVERTLRSRRKIPLADDTRYYRGGIFHRFSCQHARRKQGQESVSWAELDRNGLKVCALCEPEIPEEIANQRRLAEIEKLQSKIDPLREHLPKMTGHGRQMYAQLLDEAERRPAAVSEDMEGAE